MKKYYSDKGKWYEITNKSPKGFKGVLLIVRIGTESGRIEETAWSTEQVKNFPTLPGVEEETKLDWLKTFEPDKVPPEPEPEPNVYIQKIDETQRLVQDMKNITIGFAAMYFITMFILFTLICVLG